LKCGSLNLLEPSGPVQACNGIALLFTVGQHRQREFENAVLGRKFGLKGEEVT